DGHQQHGRQSTQGSSRCGEFRDHECSGTGLLLHIICADPSSRTGRLVTDTFDGGAMRGIVAVLMVLAAPVALAYTAAELAEKNVQAKGGIDRLHRIESLRLTGKMLVNGDSIKLGVVTLIKRPQSVRYEA